MHGFANILLSGNCNANCPYCIGKLSKAFSNNLNVFPLVNLSKFIAILNKENINQISITGINTDPLLYKHLDKLINYLKSNIPNCKINIHTNGIAIKQTATLINQCNRICISYPSFEKDIYKKMMGIEMKYSLGEMIKLLKIPIKISCILTQLNKDGIFNYIYQLQQLGIKRLVIRKLYQQKSKINDVIETKNLGIFKNQIYGNKVYELDGMEITLWEFENTQAKCFNLYPDGTISDKYLILN